MSRFTNHSVVTDESLGRRFCRALDENGDTKSEVLRSKIVEYAEDTEGDTTDSLERRIEELREEKREHAEERKRAAREERLKEERIGDLEARLDDLRSEGDYDELFEAVVGLARSGANLRVVNDKTGKLDRLRALGSHDSLEEVIRAVNDTAKAGDGDE
ncbi:hypothetical protein AUR64_17290 [Haloprofundus marisrubri]|uniref:Uncharacterized protein n=1 Tax=Haloprofundus marisrubri TaxID=1514971 RepID=A0A0W1R8D6_9EURY|nr:hypothetical protein [Haloprofundus marisrubri]KTG09521.1 hypothetical protein AUR64_17290 [Haloprofundus marisrubri]